MLVFVIRGGVTWAACRKYERDVSGLCWVVPWAGGEDVERLCGGVRGRTSSGESKSEENGVACAFPFIRGPHDAKCSHIRSPSGALSSRSHRHSLVSSFRVFLPPRPPSFCSPPNTPTRPVRCHTLYRRHLLFGRVGMVKGVTHLACGPPALPSQNTCQFSLRRKRPNCDCVSLVYICHTRPRPWNNVMGIH